MRTRFATIAVSAAVVAPFALMGGSANAVEAPVVGNVATPVDGLLGGVLGGAGGGLLGGAGLGTVTSAASNPLAATDIVTGTLGGVLGGGALSGVTNIADLEGVLSTVTGLVDLDGIIKTVTDLVGTVIDTLNLDDILALPVKILSPTSAVKGATKTSTKTAKVTPAVEAGALPHTGGNADLTAMLLCAGLAAAGTGVTMVTRRRGSLLGA